MEPLRSCTVGTPLGALVVAVSDGGVVETGFVDDEREVDEVLARIGERFARAVRPSARGLAPLVREVEGYFAGRVRTFATPPDLSWLPAGFSRRVLEVTTTIPFGELWTYGDVAEMAGSARAGRAAGGALSHCPIELFVPCHRVVHAGGTLGGYGRHEHRKRWLILHEREPDASARRRRG